MPRPNLRSIRARSASELNTIQRDGVAVDDHAVHLAAAGRILIRPALVVDGAGREHLELDVPRQPLGDLAAMLLATTAHFDAVALDDEGDPHAPGEMPGLLSLGARAAARALELGQSRLEVVDRGP